jgi:ketosteroid isomerase-like protein
MILTIGMCLLIAAVPAVAQNAADEAAIREASKQSRELLNKGDIKGHLDMYADPFMVFGNAAAIRTGHETNHQESIARSKDNPANTKMLDEIGIVFLSADSAIHQFRVQDTGGIDEDGNAMPSPRKAYIARVYMKQNGKWLLKAIFDTPIEE